MTVERNENSVISIVVPLYQPDGSTYDPSVAYGTGSPVTPAADGTVLNDDAKGSFKFTAEVKSTFIGEDGLTYTKGSIAKTFTSNTSVENVWLTIGTVNDVKHAVATILEGLHGVPGGRAYYLLTVYTKRDNTWVAVKWVNIEVLGKPKLT